MKAPELTFHHLGMACEEPERATRFLKALGYSVGEPAHDELQNVNLALCTSQRMPNVELLWPTGSGAPSPLDAILRHGGGAYHLCYSTRNREQTLEELKAQGHRIVTVAEARPAVLFGRQTVSFHFIAGFGLIELLESSA